MASPAEDYFAGGIGTNKRSDYSLARPQLVANKRSDLSLSIVVNTRCLDGSHL